MKREIVRVPVLTGVPACAPDLRACADLASAATSTSAVMESHRSGAAGASGSVPFGRQRMPAFAIALQGF
jgi:hypothetical protein